MAICVEADVIGSKQHLICDESSVKWVDQCPGDVFCLRPRAEPESGNCLRTLAELNQIELSAPSPAGHTEAFKELLKNHDVGLEAVVWKDALPRPAYLAYVKDLVSRVSATYARCARSYYQDSFNRHTRLFEALRPAKIDFEKLKIANQIERNEVNLTTLASFMPGTTGYARPVRYDRLSTRTGRLIIETGPQVLTLKRKYRNILSSRYEGGRVVSIDYSSLEARVMLYSVDKAAPAGDLYDSIAQEVFMGKLPRDAVKLGVLALIFGMGDAHLASTLSIDYQNAKKLSKAIKKYFCVAVLERRLRKELEEKGSIRNHYGRALAVPEEKLALNSYIQSTGVDVALHGFTNIVEQTAKRELEFVPLFVLHDALIADVSPKAYASLSELTVAAETVPSFVPRFPVHVTDFAH